MSKKQPLSYHIYEKSFHQVLLTFVNVNEALNDKLKDCWVPPISTFELKNKIFCQVFDEKKFNSKKMNSMDIDRVKSKIILFSN